MFILLIKAVSIWSNLFFVKYYYNLKMFLFEYTFKGWQLAVELGISVQSLILERVFSPAPPTQTWRRLPD